MQSQVETYVKTTLLSPCHKMNGVTDRQVETYVKAPPFSPCDKITGVTEGKPGREIC